MVNNDYNKICKNKYLIHSNLDTNPQYILTINNS